MLYAYLLDLSAELEPAVAVAVKAQCRAGPGKEGISAGLEEEGMSTGLGLEEEGITPASQNGLHSWPWCCRTKKQLSASPSHVVW